MRVREFEWDEGNELHLALGHGIEPEEAEQVFARSPLIRKTKKGNYAAFGKTSAGRLLVIIFDHKGSGYVRVITGWDMKAAERRYYQHWGKGKS
ncbi:BrnT family toxin [bacterium]|nr:BrnT family toxin [bacterium]